jgi:hypothetical protein
VDFFISKVHQIALISSFHALMVDVPSLGFLVALVLTNKKLDFSLHDGKPMVLVSEQADGFIVCK